MFPRFAILLGLLALTARPGSAQSYTWTGGGANGNWSTSGNWSGGNVPASNISNSVVSFNSTSTRRLATTNDLSNLQLNKIVVGSPSGNVSVRGNAITLGGGGIDLSSATLDLTVSAPLTVAADQLWAVPSGRALAIGGILSGANNLTIGGSGVGGTVNLTAANTFAGTVTVNAGTLSVSNILGASARVVVGAGGTFQARGALTIAGLSGAGILENRSTTNRTLTVNSTANGEFSGTIRNGGTGTLGLTKTGSGTLTLSGANEFTGTTTVSGGVLVASSSLASNVVVNAAGTFRAGASVGVGLLTGAAGGVVESGTAGGATLTVNAATSGTFAGTIRDGAGPLGLNKAGAGTLTLSGANTYTGPTTVSGGTLVVSNTLPSAVTVLPGAVLRGTGAAAFGANSSVNVVANHSDSPDPNGLFQVQQSFTIGSLTGDGVVENGVTGTRVLTVAGGAFAGTIRNGASGTLGLTKTGSGTLTLTGSNGYTGITTVAGGVLRVSNLQNGGVASNIGASSNAAANLVLNGGTLRYTGSATATTDRGFTLGTNGGTLDASGTGEVRFTGTTAVALSGTNAARTLTLTGDNTGPNTLRNPLGNNGTGLTSVTKTGIGSWVLSGANTFTGSLTVNGGTLRVAAGGSLSSSTTAVVSVNSGGTLGGAGTIGRRVNVAAGGTVAPGDAGVGTLTVGNTVTFAANGRLAADLGAGTAADRLTITGTTNGLNFATGADLDLVAAGFSRTAPATFTLAGLANGANLRLDGTGVANLAVLGTYVQGSGSTGRVDIGVGNLGTPLATGDKFVLSRNANNLVLTFTPAPVPEPATVLGIAAAGLGLAGWVRRRVQSSSGPAARASSRSSCERRPSAIRTAPGSITTSPLGL